MSEWPPERVTAHEPGGDWTCTCGYDYFGGTAAYSMKLFRAHLPEGDSRREARKTKNV